MESFLEERGDCIEGILICKRCFSKFPIIGGVAIIVENFCQYATERVETFGRWFSDSKSPELRTFLKEEGMKLIRPGLVKNRYEEDDWFRPYLWTHYDYSLEDKFLSMLRWKIKPDEIYRKSANLTDNNIYKVGLDVGCSVGAASLMMASKFSFVFGIDSSFSFITESRKRMKEKDIRNVEFLVCDSSKMPFELHLFDVILALNIIGRVDLEKTLLSFNRLIKPNGKLIFADPYDQSREQIKSGMDPGRLRSVLEKSGYEVTVKNKKNESFIPWIIKVNERCYIFYFLDFIEARRTKKA
ncbi:MAG: class I SAM-dependent methyltransferase [Thermoproteota archaeon]|nr:class I SAM-dependent methyltransferase [Thermoproteota archaeon]